MILRGGLVVDGTGSAGVIADVAVENGLIVAVGDLADRDDEDSREVAGLVVAPGFVDIHSHSDLSILGHRQGTSKVLQGVTTEVVGNCGLAVTPVSSLEVAALLRPLMSYCEDPSVTWDWTDVTSYRARVAAVDPALSIEVLAGHNTIRASVMGLEARAATDAEVGEMSRMLDQALEDGALGMSLGLMYPPSSYADEAELIALGRVIARHDAILASHMADYSEGLLDAVAAMIRIGEASGCRVQVSHLTAVGRPNWGLVARALEAIDAAVERGVDVAADFYPYLAGSTNLSQALPGWAMAGGFGPLRVRLADRADRARILEHFAARTLGWHETLLVTTSSAPELDGLLVTEAADRRGVEPAELVLGLLAECDPTIVGFGRSEDDLRAVMRHPRSVLGSDGLAVDTAGSVGGRVPHPRFFGAFPALFERYVREEHVLGLEEAVRKCTSAPAERVRLRDRGRIAPGLRADLVVFDQHTIADRSSYSDSRQVPAGIASVYRGGIEIARDGVVLA
ncbi:D-aminoacylase [soil metagenome]